MREKKHGFESLDKRIDEVGRDIVAADIVTRIAEGEGPVSIARSYGVPYLYIRRFIETECSEDAAIALRARADVVEHKGTEAVLDATPDTVSVARLQGEYLLKLAGKLNRAKYGEKVLQEISGPDGGDIKLVVSPIELIVSRLADIAARLPAPLVIENGEDIE